MFCSLVLVSFEKIYQKLEVLQKLSAARRIFSLFPVLGYEMKHSINNLNKLLLLFCRLIILGISFSFDLVWESLTIL